MKSQEAYDFVVKNVIVAGMRGGFSQDVTLATAETLMAEGINMFELTMNSTDPIGAMQAVKREYGSEALVGMGTVLDVETVKRVLDAGADFVVSPAFQPEVVAAVMAADVFMAPGVTTPSEAVAAWGMGVKMLKLFPIGALGVEYFKAIMGPLKHMKFMCNGGMDAENSHDLLKAGAVAVGMAGWLTGDGTMSQEAIRTRARQLKRSVEMAQGNLPVI